MVTIMFERIKTWYEKGMWTKRMERDAVRKGKITPQQYEEITGEVYNE